MAKRSKTYKVTEEQLAKLAQLAFLLETEVEHIRLVEPHLPASDMAMTTIDDFSITEDEFLAGFASSIRQWIRIAKYG